MRYTQDGQEIPEFVLNQPAYRKAEIIVAGDNFGCGSSREHAPWALADYGIRVVIAPTFADIFFNNCFQNGMLPIRLEEADVDELFRRAAAGPYRLTADLERNELRDDRGFSRPIDIDPFRRTCLMKGLDNIGLTLAHAPAIDAWESAHGMAPSSWMAR